MHRIQREELDKLLKGDANNVYGTTVGDVRRWRHTYVEPADPEMLLRFADPDPDATEVRANLTVVSHRSHHTRRDP